MKLIQIFPILIVGLSLLSFSNVYSAVSCNNGVVNLLAKCPAKQINGSCPGYIRNICAGPNCSTYRKCVKDGATACKIGGGCDKP